MYIDLTQLDELIYIYQYKMEKNRKICNIILLAITLLLEMIILFVSTNILQGLFLSCVNILSTVLLLWFQKGDKKESMRPIWILVLLLTSLFCIIVLCGWKILPTVTAYLHVKSAIQSLFILFSIFCVAFSFSVYFRFDIWKIFIFAGGILGFCMMLIIPLGAVPDEVIHIHTAYSLSNSMLGIENSIEGLMMRADDAVCGINDFGRSAYYSVEQYEEYYANCLVKLTDATIVNANVKVLATRYPYVISAIGITVGRLLGLGTYATLFLGRTLNFVVYLAVCCYALKILPKGKIPMFILLLTPMCLQQGMSYSYDSMVISISFLVLSEFLLLKKSSSDCSKKHLIISLLAFGLLWPIKGHAYMLIAILPLGVLFFRWLNDKPKIRKTVYLVFGLLVVFAILVVIYVVVSIKKNGYSPNYVDIGQGLTEGYSIGYFVDYPLELLKIAYLTLKRFGLIYVYQAVGQNLGWLDINIPLSISKGFICLLILSLFQNDNGDLHLTVKERGLLVGISVLTTCFIFGGMLLQWSPMDQKIIQGLQGRYFVPIIPYLIMSVSTEKSRFADILGLVLIVATGVLSLFTLERLIVLYMI